MAEPLVPAPPSRERLFLLMAAVLAEIAAAAALVRAEGAFFQEHALGLSSLTGGGFRMLGTTEARFFVAHATAGLPAALLLADASSRLLGGREAPWSFRVIAHPRRTAIVFALFAAAVSALIATTVLGHTTLTDDEGVYVAQARHLLAGSFSAPAPGLANAFPFDFMVSVRPNRWAGAYPLGQPMLIALSLLIPHTPYLLQPLFAGATVYVAACLAHELWDAETSVVTAALLGTSPFLLFNAATLHNAVPATFFCLVAVRAARNASRRGGRLDHALAGAAIGAAFLCRPYDAAAVALPIGFVLVRAAVRPATPSTPVRGTAGLALAVACALPSLFVYLAANRATTGHPLVPAYSYWLEQRFPGAKTVGFGPAVFGGMHTTQVMFSKGLVVLTRLSAWLFGWPFSLWPLMALLLGVGRDHRSRLLLAVLTIHFGAYCLYTSNAVQDLGSPYHLVEAPLIALLSARAIVALGGKLHTFGDQLAMWPGRLALASSVIGLFTFWPEQAAWARQTAEYVRAPRLAAERAAGGHPALVFWETMHAPENPPGSNQRSSVLYPPVPGPKLDDPILWAQELGEQDAVLLARYPERTPFRLVWDAAQKPQIVPYTMQAGPPQAGAAVQAGVPSK